MILTGMFAEGFRYACLGLVVLATLATVGERRREDGGWWLVLAAGAALSVAGAALAGASDTLGGLVAVVGGALVVIGAIVGFPTDGEGEGGDEQEEG